MFTGPDTENITGNAQNRGTWGAVDEPMYVERIKYWCLETLGMLDIASFCKTLIKECSLREYSY